MTASASLFSETDVFFDAFSLSITTSLFVCSAFLLRDFRIVRSRFCHAITLRYTLFYPSLHFKIPFLTFASAIYPFLLVYPLISLHWP